MTKGHGNRSKTDQAQPRLLAAANGNKPTRLSEITIKRDDLRKGPGLLSGNKTRRNKTRRPAKYSSQHLPPKRKIEKSTKKAF